ncbi:hypothetical protein FK529_05695 [Tsukamurella asaccharolytica]|uniref:Uncharacterized protein n=1 Tax=Tsukamurella asaccharolytica TaxID=2592067 RepID=A0A5C5RFE7_9ACTN|nr:hypothetical protein [Tsukamurella asaccharolytica]TWS20815.1 hypothetical protein FK529_05695 [Tsukamurella asaccharolytica]
MTTESVAPAAASPKILSTTSRRETVWRLARHTTADAVLPIPGDKRGRTLRPDLIEVTETLYDGADAPAPKLSIHVSGQVVNPSTGDLGTRRRIVPPVPLAPWLVELVAKSVTQ